MRNYILLIVLFLFITFDGKSVTIQSVTGYSGTISLSQTDYKDNMNVQYNINTGESSKCVKLSLSYGLETGCDYLQVYECDDNFSSWVFLGSTYWDYGNSVTVTTSKANGKVVVLFYSDPGICGADGYTGFTIKYDTITTTSSSYSNQVINNVSSGGTYEIASNSSSAPNLTVTDYSGKNMGTVNSVTTTFANSVLLLKSGNYELGLGSNKISSNGYLGISGSQIYYTAFTHTFANRAKSKAFVISDNGIYLNARTRISSDFIYDSEGGDGAIYYGNQGSGDLWFRKTPNHGIPEGYSDVMILKNSGSLGIGTTSPSAKLDVFNSENPAINISTSTSNHLQFGLSTCESCYATGTISGDAVIRTLGGRNTLIFSINNDNNDGNSFIGFQDDKNGIWYKVLNNKTVRIDGTVYATEIKVKTNVWADDVFSPQYKLRKLTDLDSYIKINGHLPEIPKTEEVKKDGIDVAEMQTKLLQKVEELTLYLIELKKEIECQRKENQLLRDKIFELQYQNNRK